MSRKKLYLIIALGLLLVLPLGVGGGVSQASPPRQGPPAAIKLKAATFVPGLGQAPAIPPGLTIAGYAQAQRGYYIVQFNGPVEQAWKDQLTALGAELLGYIPDFAFKVRMNPAQAARVENLNSVAWVGLFQPAYKLSPDLAREGTNLYRVRVERGADAGLTMAAVVQSGAQVLRGQGSNILLVAADSGQLDAIAQVLDVAWVENFVLPQKHNEFGAGVIMGANTANANGYDGSTQTVAVADTGLGGGTAATAHPDIPANRVIDVFDWPAASVGGCYTAINDGAIDVDSGHGTHVAVSVLGDGDNTGQGKGTAPAANLVFQSVEDFADMAGQCALFYPDGYYLLGLPDDLRNLYQQAYNAGARIHSNSWGSSQAGVYTLDSANTDDFIWDNPDMTITFSAGNEGADANADGVVDNDSIGSPATAKNVITVGASENERSDNYPCDTNLTYASHDAYQPGQTCGSMGGQNLLGTAGQRWGFTTEPLNSDLTAGNKEQMAPFSSRGPTDDGRIKPDVVAPGTWVLSGYSSLYQEGYGDPTNPRNGAYQLDGWGMPFNDQYKYFGGTSMSNPLAAGAAAVVRDYYQKAHTHAASAALVKATLINSAVDLLDENNDGANDNDFPIPNEHEGWGRINLANATDGSAQFVDEAAGLNTGGSASYQYSIATAGQPFKVSLVWSDFPSTENAAQNLVNDLDLVVTAPGGTKYRGNIFSGGWSQTGGNADSTNNVENVYIQSAAAGTWTVQVSGANVPNGPQPYALVMDGAFGVVDNPPTVTITNPTDGATVSGTINITADASDDNGVTQVEFFVDGGSIGVDTTAPYEITWDSTTVVDGNHMITATATDAISQIASDSNNVNVDNIADPTVHVGNLDGSSTDAPHSRWEATVTITVHDSNEEAISGALVEGNWSGGANGGDSCTTDANGQCSVIKANLKGNVGSVTFGVSNVTSSAGAYAAVDNHDPDGDSDGTTIIVNKPAANTLPTTTITAPADGATFDSGATISFTGTANDAEDGDVTASLVWTSNIDGQIGTGGSFNVVLNDGNHTITATATDSAGASGSDTIIITVGSMSFSLSVTAYKVKGVQHADLTWSGANSADVDIYRDGDLVTATANDGIYTDNLGQKGGGSAIYQVCETGTSTCSNTATATW
jgi:serine protease AprX